ARPLRPRTDKPLSPTSRFAFASSIVRCCAAATVASFEKVWPRFSEEKPRRSGAKNTLRKEGLWSSAARTIPCAGIGSNRDRGESRDSSPPTPPDVRVRIRRFGGLSRPRHRDGSQAKGPQGASG